MLTQLVLGHGPYGKVEAEAWECSGMWKRLRGVLLPTARP